MALICRMLCSMAAATAAAVLGLRLKFETYICHDHAEQDFSYLRMQARPKKVPLDTSYANKSYLSSVCSAAR